MTTYRPVSRGPKYWGALCCLLAPAAAWATVDTYEVTLFDASSNPVYMGQFQFNSDNPSPPPAKRPAGSYDFPDVTPQTLTLNKVPGAQPQGLPNTMTESGNSVVVWMADVDYVDKQPPYNKPPAQPGWENHIVGTFVEGQSGTMTGNGSRKHPVLPIQQNLTCTLALAFATNGSTKPVAFTKTWSMGCVVTPPPGVPPGPVVLSATGKYGIRNLSTPGGVPAPATALLIGLGLVALRGLSRRHRKAARLAA